MNDRHRKSAKKGVASSNVCRKNYSLDIFSHFLVHKIVYIHLYFYKELKIIQLHLLFELLPRALRMHEWPQDTPATSPFNTFSCPRGSRKMFSSDAWKVGLDRASVALEISKALLFTLCSNLFEVEFYHKNKYQLKFISLS